jgi:phosphatidylserine/phosphatidylglycerophosphate/cardiolipin synthase-like enzyme
MGIYIRQKNRKFAEIDSIDIKEKKLVSNAKMKLIVSNPLYSSENSCTEEYRRIISKAKELEIGSLYFHPPKKIIEALDQALDNGADVKILSNGTAGDVPLQNYLTASASKVHYAYLNRILKNPLNNNTKRKSMEVFEYQVPENAYHAKILVAKDKEGVEEGVIGSYNLAYRSHEADDEAIVVFENSNLVQQLKTILEEDRKLANKITIETSLSLLEGFVAKFSQAFLFIG